MLKAITLLLFALSFSLQAEPEFKPHMIDHDLPGCPANSDCSRETGEKRLKWLELLKNINNLSEKKRVQRLESHRKTFGIPLSFWILPDHKIKPEIIVWDSHCKQHSKEEMQKILLGEAFMKDFSKIEKLDGVMVKKVYLAKGSKVLSFSVPRRDAPLSLDNDRLYYTREDEGYFYGLYFTSTGSISVTKVSFPKKSPIEVACPKNLVEQFQKDQKLPNLYSGHYCKSLWNKSRSKRQTILIGWSCN